MSFFWQLHPQYNKNDVWQNISDIWNIFELFEEKERKKFEQKILNILSEPDTMLFRIRNMLYSCLKDSISWEEIDKSKWWFDRFNQTYQQLAYLYDCISINPVLRNQFLNTLQVNLTQELEKFPTRGMDVLGKTTDISDENFDAMISGIFINGWHIAVLYSLRECIKEWKCLWKVSEYLDLKQKQSLVGASLEDMDYFNLRSQLDFKKSLEWNNGIGKSFSLSGGVSNALSQLWYIRSFLLDWGRINSISGTSMGAIVGVLVSRVVWKKQWQDAVIAMDDIITSLSGELSEQITKLGKIWKLPYLEISKIPEFLQKERNSISTKDIKAVKDVFLNLAHKYWITDSTKFSELEIPVIVNASYQSWGDWEKEIILSGDNLVIASLFAWGNMPTLFDTNVGIFWENPIKDQNMVDFAANEQWNPISLLTDVGVPMKDIVVLDVWYSSLTYNTTAAWFSRWFFRRALFRDSLQKTAVRMQWGISVDIDSEPSNNTSWSEFSSKILDDLVEIGKQAYVGK